MLHCRGLTGPVTIAERHSLDGPSISLRPRCSSAAGIVVNGPNPWDPQIHDQRFWNRLLAEGSLGLGEAYMDGWWDCADLAEFFNRVLTGDIHKHLKLTANHVWQLLQARAPQHAEHRAQPPRRRDALQRDRRLRAPRSTRA